MDLFFLRGVFLQPFFKEKYNPMGLPDYCNFGVTGIILYPKSCASGIVNSDDLRVFAIHLQRGIFCFS